MMTLVLGEFANAGDLDLSWGEFAFLKVDHLSNGELKLWLNATIPADDAKGTVPTYRFDMRVGEQVVGGIRFRAGWNRDVELYAGNIGYNVDPEFRGRRFAERACKLLIPLAMAHGFDGFWITCDPDNFASQATCERLGAVLVDTVKLPEHLDMYRDGEREKCRYWLVLPVSENVVT